MLEIDGVAFRSRLMVGTGKYRNNTEMVEAIRYARLAREAGFNDFVKLEVIGDQATLLPDTVGLLEATKVLAAEGFKVLASGLGVEAGRAAYLAGRMPRREVAIPSSPTTGMLD